MKKLAFALVVFSILAASASAPATAPAADPTTTKAGGLTCSDPQYKGVCVVGAEYAGWYDNAPFGSYNGAVGQVSVPTRGTVISVIGDPRAGHKHQGIDIMNSIGTPIYAFEAGTVSKASNQDSGTCGRGATIQHPDGLRSIYCHLNSVSVSVGQQVRLGQVIGEMGKTGNARTTPPHLHFEIRRGGEVLDPCTYLQCRGGTRFG